MNTGHILQTGKLIIISAPSGCGKSTIIKALDQRPDMNFAFSVSATNRSPRPGEIDGVHYNFLTTEQFREAVDHNEFIEWEEVYPGRYYGTLRTAVDSMLAQGRNVVLDIDVKGALNVKKLYGDAAITIFIAPPSIAELRRRLENRGTETADVIDTRVARAEFEMSLAPQFDRLIVNDDLDQAVARTADVINQYLIIK